MKNKEIKEILNKQNLEDLIKLQEHISSLIKYELIGKGIIKCQI